MQRQPIGELLDCAPRGEVLVGRDWWSWNGAHGGLVVALATAAAQAAAPERPVRSVSARLRAPAQRTLHIESMAQRGVTVKLVTVSIHEDRLIAEATCVLGRDTGGPSQTPPAPRVSGPERYDVLEVNPEIMPFLSHVEIRPVRSLPLAGADDPELAAWVRLTDDDKPPDACRLAALLDALPPSLVATLTEPMAIPTVELSFHVGPALTNATADGSPWAFVEASTRWALRGWVSEEVRAWAPGGALLGVAQQLRLVVG
jgi:hypothetical protein